MPPTRRRSATPTCSTWWVSSDPGGVDDGSSVGEDVEELEEGPSPEVDDGTDGSGSSDGVGSSVGAGASEVVGSDGVGSSVGRGEIEMVGSVTERLNVGRPLKVGRSVGRSPEHAANVRARSTRPAGAHRRLPGGEDP